MLIHHVRNLLPLALLTTSTLAQNTTTSNTTCSSPNYNPDAPVNASALVPFNITSAPWSLTISLNDTRTNASARHSLNGWLSSPANATGRACVYWLTNLLSASSGPNGDCTGSLSENCVDMLRRSVVVGAADSCPNLPSRDAFEKACGGSGLADGYQAVFTTNPLDLGNATCPSARVPGGDQPPSSSFTRQLFGVTFNGDETSDSNDPAKFTWYDKYATQPMPWIVAVDQDGQTETRVVCVTPKKVPGGGRDPGTSGAEQVGIGFGIWSAVGVGFVMAML